MNFPLIANVVVFAVLLFALGQTRHKQWSLGQKSAGRSGDWRGLWSGAAANLRV